MNTIRIDLWQDEKRAKDTGHAVLIAWDEPNTWHLFSNNEYWLIESGDWRTPVIERKYLGKKYSVIDIFSEHDQGVIS